MDARLLRASILLAVTWVLGTDYSLQAGYAASPRGAAATGGSCQSKHFIVSAPTPAFARQVCEAAEQYRHALAIEWLGTELPPWGDLCPIRVIVGAQLGAGGATTFTFINGQPRDWHMEIQGSQERILDSVLPHEITHTIFATHFGRPLPRWADEGAATSVEHVSERTKQDQLLIQFLMSNRGIAFNHMFAMKEYPRDILPLYSQGYSLARYLIAQGGRRKYVDYVFDGMRWNNWTAATRKHYGLGSLSELQVTWLAWVRQGSPAIRVPAPDRGPAPNLLADNTSNDSAAPFASAPGDSLAGTDHASGLVPLPSRVSPRPKDLPLARADMTADGDTYTSGPQEGWYTRERDRAMNPSVAATTDLRPATPPSSASIPAPEQRGYPQTAPGPGQVLLDSSRSDRQTGTLLR
jgi:hypothetical protein